MSPVRSRSPAPGKYSIYRLKHLHPECGIVPPGLLLQPHAQDMTCRRTRYKVLPSFGRQNGGPCIYEKCDSGEMQNSSRMFAGFYGTAKSRASSKPG